MMTCIHWINNINFEFCLEFSTVLWKSLNISPLLTVTFLEPPFYLLTSYRKKYFGAEPNDRQFIPTSGPCIQLYSLFALIQANKHRQKHIEFIVSVVA